MARPTTKTPAQILAELEAKTQAARIRLAQEGAKANPIMAKMVATRDAIAKDINALSRKLKGPQSFNMRKLGIALRSAWIEAEEAQTIAQDTLLRQRKDFVDASMAVLADRIAKGETVTDSDVTNILASMPNNPEIVGLILATETASQAFREFTAEKNANQKDSDTVAEPVQNASEGS